MPQHFSSFGCGVGLVAAPSAYPGGTGVRRGGASRLAAEVKISYVTLPPERIHAYNRAIAVLAKIIEKGQ